MFNMEFIGRKIAELRKAKDMTQLELADKINISFQAVSNWERGISMPDISKLPELAEIFDVSVDELIGGESPLLASVIKGTEGSYARESAVSQKEFKDIAPLIKPSQADEIFSNVNPPFDLKDIDEILPFLSREVVDSLAEKLISQNKSISEIAPFVSREKIDELALESYEVGGLSNLTDIAPFIGSDALSKIAELEYERRGLRHFDEIAPFLDKALLNSLAKQAIEKDGIKAVSPIAPFLDKDMLGEFVKERFI